MLSHTQRLVWLAAECVPEIALLMRCGKTSEREPKSVCGTYKCTIQWKEDRHTDRQSARDVHILQSCSANEIIHDQHIYRFDEKKRVEINWCVRVRMHVCVCACVCVRVRYMSN